MASLTAMTGNSSILSAAMARRRITPVVVSSVPPMMSVQQFAAILVDGGDQVRAVIHGHVRFVVERRGDVLVVRNVVLALDGEGGDFVDVDQRGRHVILRGERIGGRQNQVRAAFLQGARQVGCLGGDVQAGRHAHALERLLFLEALADLAQDGHFALGPVDAAAAAFGLVDVFDIVIAHENSLILEGREMRTESSCTTL